MTADEPSDDNPTERAEAALLLQPNAETLVAFAEIERGGLERFASLDALFADLHANDRGPAALPIEPDQFPGAQKLL